MPLQLGVVQDVTLSSQWYVTGHQPSTQTVLLTEKADTNVCHTTFAPHFLSQLLLCYMKVKRTVLQNDSLLNAATAAKRKCGGKKWTLKHEVVSNNLIANKTSLIWRLITPWTNSLVVDTDMVFICDVVNLSAWQASEDKLWRHCIVLA